ncbi:MAG: DUF4249 family protein [Bacteroidetes bacterium]|nr:DUF4249 family protein [Bacteroidota bacterium]
MKNSFLVTLISLLGFSFFISCENDLDIVSPYKDTTIVYCLLDLSDSVHWVRVHKAFLGPGDAEQMAAYADSIYYSDQLTVKLERWVNNQLYGVINFARDSSVTKEPGLFAESPNILYKSYGIDNLFDDSEYRLLITNRKTGKVISAAANMIQKPFISNPSSGSISLSPGPFNIKLNTGKYAKTYDVKIVFNYIEQSKADSSLIVNKQTIWNAGVIEAPSTDGSQPVTYTLKREEFAQFLKSTIKPDPTVYRYTGKLDFYFAASDNTMFEYQRINNANGVNSGNALLFTNIQGGLGLMACKRTDVKSGQSLSGQTVLFIQTSPETSNLGFVQ